MHQADDTIIFRQSQHWGIHMHHLSKIRIYYQTKNTITRNTTNKTVGLHPVKVTGKRKNDISPSVGRSQSVQKFSSIFSLFLPDDFKWVTVSLLPIYK